VNKGFHLKRNETITLIALALVVFLAIRAAVGANMINDYWQRVLDQALITTMGALGLSLIYGFCGQFSLGHAAFYGIGAYTAAYISKVYGQGSIPFFIIAVVAGTLMAALMAYLIGRPILRLRSDYLGIATLGFGIIMRVGFENSDKVLKPLGGATGMTGVPQLMSFTWIFVFTVITIFLVRNFVTSTFGRACVAIREDEIAADAMGINTTKVKTMAFVLGCAVVGFAGALYAHRYPYLHPSNFDFLKSFDFLLIVVLGGLGSMTGTIITAVSWVFLLEGLRVVLGQTFVDFRGVIYALILIISIILRPQGIFGGREWKMLVPAVRPARAPLKEGGTHVHAGGK